MLQTQIGKSFKYFTGPGNEVNIFCIWLGKEIGRRAFVLERILYFSLFFSYVI